MKRSLSIIVSFILPGLLLSPGGLAYAETKTIKLGLNAPLTGRGASYGIPYQRVLKMNIKKWNEEGGITIGRQRYKVELIEDDNKYKGPIARSVAEKHCYRDKVVAAFTIGSTPSAAAGSIYSKNMVPFFCVGSATSKIIGPDKPYVFNFFVGREVYNLAFFRWVNRELGVKTVVQIFPNDDAGRAGVKVNEEIFPKLGMSNLAAIPVERDDVDFTAAITRAVALKPDAIDFSASPAQTALFAKQSYELNFKGKRISESPSIDAGRIKEVAGKGGDGLTSIGLFEEGPLVTSALMTLIKEYTEITGHMDIMLDTHQLIADTWRGAVEKAGTLDPEKVMKTLASMKLHHALGEARLIGKEIWGIDRQALYPVAVSEARNGKAYSVGILSAEELYQDYLDRVKAEKK